MTYDLKTFWNERCKKLGHTGWDDSALYRHDQPLRLKTVMKFLSSHGIDLARRTRILDIGCGIGDFIEMFASKGAEVVGIDVSEEAVRRARQRFKGMKNVKIFVGKVENLDALLDPESFDLVTSITVLQHVVREDLFFSSVEKVIRVPKPGGYILLLEAVKGDGSLYNHVAKRSRQKWVKTFEDVGCKLIDESSYPQWASLSLRMSHLRGMDERKAPLAKKILHGIVLGATRMLDKQLFVPVPRWLAEDEIFLFQKSMPHKKESG